MFHLLKNPLDSPDFTAMASTSQSPALKNLEEAATLIQQSQEAVGTNPEKVTENLAKVSTLLETERKRASGVLSKFRLDGQVALVTGGSRGIGFAIARALGEAGCKVAVASVNITNAEKATKELINAGIESIAIKADVSKKDDVVAMVKAVLDTWGDLHIAVNNAGVAFGNNAEDITEEEYDQLMGINLKGVFLSCQAEAKHMLTKGYGRIINIASISGYIVNKPQNQCTYNASKAAVSHLTKSMAAEWVDRGVLVNSISPGYIETDMLGGELRKDWRKVWTELTPMKRFGDPEELVGLVLFMASSLSSFMTGSDVIIDGGYTLW